jgi:hypothetical protein
MNHVAQRVLGEALGTSPPSHRPVLGRSLDSFIGGWSQEQVDEFEGSLKDLERIDSEQWR